MKALILLFALALLCGCQKEVPKRLLIDTTGGANVKTTVPFKDGTKYRMLVVNHGAFNNVTELWSTDSTGTTITIPMPHGRSIQAPDTANGKIGFTIVENGKPILKVLLETK